MTALVFGVGNPARGDDGVGRAVAELAAADPRFAAAVVRGVTQLTPELAVEIVQASVVVVVDARAGDPPGQVSWAVAEPPARTAAPVFSHHLTAAALAALCAFAYGRAPPVVVVGVGAAAFDAGAPLSDPVAAAVPRAVDLAACLLRERSPRGTGRGASPAR